MNTIQQIVTGFFALVFSGIALTVEPLGMQMLNLSVALFLAVLLGMALNDKDSRE